MSRHLVPQNGHVSLHFDLCQIRYTPGKESDDGVLLYLQPPLKGDDPEDSNYKTNVFVSEICVINEERMRARRNPPTPSR